MVSSKESSKHYSISGSMTRPAMSTSAASPTDPSEGRGICQAEVRLKS